jgi:vitamin B12 transporter
LSFPRAPTEGERPKARAESVFMATFVFTPPRVRTTISVAVLLALAHPSARAQSQLESITITAARTAQTRAEAMADIVVIDRAAIDQSGAQTIAQLLAQYAGVEIAETGGQGKVSGVFLRGTKTAQSLILLNGSRLENASSGGANLEFLPLSAIERIEVVQGPASAVYGSAAVGGVIQIFTRTQTPATTVQASLGSDSTQRVRATSGGVFSQGNWQVFGGHERTAGFDATLPTSRNLQVDRDSSSQSNAGASLSWTASSALSMTANALTSSGRSDYDDSFSTPASAKLKFAARQVSLGVELKPTPHWQSTIKANRNQISYEFAAFEFAPNAVTRQLSWENSYWLAGRTQQLLFGLDVNHQKVAGPGVQYNQDKRTNRAYWLGVIGAAGPHQWRAQLRNDTITQTSATGRYHYAVAYGYQFDNKTVVSMSTATAFRAPTFDDLYSPFGGNPNLKSERSRNAELLIQRRDGKTDFSLALFSQVIRDAIELDADFTPQNRQETRVRGATGRWQHGLTLGSVPVTWRANLTVQDPKGKLVDATLTQTQLARRAKVHGGFSLETQWGPLSNSLALRGQGKRIDSDNSPMAGYAVVDLSARYSFNEQLAAQFKLLNVAGRQYETASGYRSQPRAAEIGLVWQAR